MEDKNGEGRQVKETREERVEITRGRVRQEQIKREDKKEEKSETREE